MTHQTLVERLRMAQHAVYLATDEPVAAQLSALLREAADALTRQEGAAPRTLSADEFEHLALMGLSPDRSLRLGEGAAERVMEACRKLETARQEGAASPAPHAVPTVCPGEDMRECGTPSPRAEGSTDAEREWATASQFVRGIIEAIGFQQPDPQAVISLEEVRLQVVGLIEDLKTQVAAHRHEHLAFVAVMNALDVHMPPAGDRLLSELRQIAATAGYPWRREPPEGTEPAAQREGAAPKYLCVRCQAEYDTPQIACSNTRVVNGDLDACEGEVREGAAQSPEARREAYIADIRNVRERLLDGLERSQWVGEGAAQEPPPQAERKRL